MRFPLRERPGENLLVWTTTPWTLTSNVAAAVNPELTYLKVKHRDQVYYVGKGAFTAQRSEEEFKHKAEWVEGVPKLKTLEQIFKEKKGGLRDRWRSHRVRTWSAGPTTARSTNCPPNSTPAGYPRRVAEVVAKQQGWAPSRCPAATSTASSPGSDVGETEGTGIVHIAPGCGKEDFGLGKTGRAAADRAARRGRRLLARASASWPARQRSLPDDGRLDHRRPAAERTSSSPSRNIRTATPTAGAARRSCSFAWSTNGSSACRGEKRS